MAFGHPAPVVPIRSAFDVDTVNLRTTLNMEEALETMLGLMNDDLIAIADGLCDLIYVAAGVAVTAGIPIISMIPRLAKWSGNEERVKFDMIAMVAATTFNLNTVIRESQFSKLEKSVHDVIYTCEKIAYHFGIPLYECFDEVQRSNMSKLGADGKPIHHDSGPKKGKVKKGPNFTPPDLEKVIREHGLTE